MPAWKAGKVLWFDTVAGEGVVIDKNGKSFYVHEGAIRRTAGKTKKHTTPVLKENSNVRFTTYKNSYLIQIDRIKEV
jgi:cold shock CspA family protein